MPRGTRSPRSPAVFSRPVPRWLVFSTPSRPRPRHYSLSSSKNQLFWQFSLFFWNFSQKNAHPHYIWLFLILISSIPRYFDISNHEKRIILLILKKNSKKILFNLKKFQIDFKSEIKYSPKFPRPRNPGNTF